MRLTKKIEAIVDSFMPKNIFKRSYFSVLACLVSAYFLYLCFKQSHFHEVFLSFVHLRFMYVFTALFFIFLFSYFKTWQSKILLSDIQSFSFKTLYAVVCRWLLMVNLLPFWTGEIYLIALLKKEEDLDKTKTLSFITLDQLCEGFTSLILFLTLSYLLPLPHSLSYTLKIISCLVLAAYLFLLILSKKMEHYTLKNPNKFFKIKSFFLNWIQHLKILKNPYKSFIALFLSLVLKSCELAAIICTQKAFGLEVDLKTALIIVGMLNFSLMLPIAAANFGPFEASILWTLQYLGKNQTQSLSLALLYHWIFLIPILLMGYYFIFLKLFKNRTAHAQN